MSRWVQIGVVVAGYGAAIAVAIVATWIYDARISALPYDTSGGMYAGGEAIYSLAVFLAVALVPTSLALWFLRRHEKFWNAIAVTSLAFAGAGLLAVLTPLATRSTRSIALSLVGLLALAQLLGMPFWFLTFALFAVLAPTREARRKLLVAIGIEVAIGGCALVHWFVRAPPF
jgi:hypothetical protein